MITLLLDCPPPHSADVFQASLTSTIIVPFVVSLIATLLGIVVVLLIERSRLPHLELRVEPRASWDGRYPGSHPRAGERWRFLRVVVRNREYPRGFRWLSRQTAEGCRVQIVLMDASGSVLFTMRGRWASTPELPMLTNPVLTLFYPDPVAIRAGEDEWLDVLAKHELDTDAFGWNNEAYFNNWRTPAYRLSPGRYELRITVTTMNGVSCSGRFEATIASAIDACTLARLQ